jgi:transcriptional regulator with XRE-family HTH domain
MEEMLLKFETIGQFLKHHRKAKKLSLGQLSDLTEKYGQDGRWSKGYIGLVENDTPTKKGAVSRPSPEKLRSICEILEAPLDVAFSLTYGQDLVIAPSHISEPPRLHSSTILQAVPELEPALLYFFRKLDADGKEEALAAVADVFHQRKKSKRPAYFDSQNPQTVPIIQEHELTPREREQADKLDEMERQRLAKRKERA